MSTEPLEDQMPLEDYLARGGKLTTPENAPPRYRGELMRLMATFIDSELAGAAGFADVINDGPGIKERIAAARIVLEKLDHAERVLDIMAEFGADRARYFGQHPWAERLPRDADIGATRAGGDMRLSVFHYPLQGWTDAVVMNVLMGKATVIQLDEFGAVSYQPLGEAFRAVLPRERRHMELGLEGLRRILEDPAARPAVESAFAYWTPRVAASFGTAASARFDAQRRFGLRRRPNESLLADWQAEIAALRADLNL
jgi:1,2-phenylacetyl-CoA epoxidase catalytic subunit